VEEKENEEHEDEDEDEELNEEAECWDESYATITTSAAAPDMRDAGGYEQQGRQLLQREERATTDGALVM
jgi:hypothetical protein